MLTKFKTSAMIIVQTRKKDLTLKIYLGVPDDKKQQALALIKNWNKLDDEGISLDDEGNYVVERVPEWADSWEQIDSYDLKDLFLSFEDCYGKKATGNTFEDLLKQTSDYKFVIVGTIGEPYIFNKNNLK